MIWDVCVTKGGFIQELIEYCTILSFQSEFLSSDSDSEEENINFVEMWKARDTSPMKLPEWNPQKSVEEHRKKVQMSP